MDFIPVKTDSNPPSRAGIWMCREFLGFLRRRLVGFQSPRSVRDPGVRDRLARLMDDYWKQMGLSEATRRQFAFHAMDWLLYAAGVERVERILGSLKGLKVLDVGCGWGAFTEFLLSRGAIVTSLDRVLPHCQGVQIRCPDSAAIMGDALHLPFKSESFDVVIMFGLIEHVGLPKGYQGPAQNDLAPKTALLHSARRVLKPGGMLVAATGNFRFPLDGEVLLWTFHWLSRQAQSWVLKSDGREADDYGLLDWPQFSGALNTSGFAVRHVEPLSNRKFLFFLVLLSYLPRRLLERFGLTPQIFRSWWNLFLTDPAYMASWEVYAQRSS